MATFTETLFVFSRADKKRYRAACIATGRLCSLCMKVDVRALISLDGAADCFCGKGKMDTIINLFQAERSEPGTPDSNSGWLADFGQLFDSATRLGSSDRVDEVVAENPPQGRRQAQPSTGLSLRPGRSPDRRASIKASSTSPTRKGSTSSASPARAHSPHRHHRRSSTSPTRRHPDCPAPASVTPQQSRPGYKDTQAERDLTLTWKAKMAGQW